MKIFRVLFFMVFTFGFILEAAAQKFSCFERKKKERIARIIGPNSAGGLSKYPWMVNLATKSGKVFCGGTLINTNLVLTAAHCIYNKDLGADKSMDSIVVRRSTSQGKPDGERRNVSAMRKHENYDSSTETNDVALIRLDRPFNISRSDLPAMLPPDRVDNWGVPGDCARVIGWGRLRYEGKSPGHLLGTDVRVWSNVECSQAYDGIGSRHICAGYKVGRRDACQGDSGGPLFVRGGPTGIYLVGIVNTGEGCGKAKRPGIYMRVSEFYDWVYKTSDSVR